MRILVQRVKQARVVVDKNEVACIGPGMLLLVGVAKDDNEKDAVLLAKKIVFLRIFEDNEEKMNLNILQVQGAILSVPQFTLYADTSRGHRPGFDQAAEPSKAIVLWNKLNQLIADNGVCVSQGVFGATMDVQLTNDGPVTLWLDSKNIC